HKAYISHVITHTTYSGASRKDIVARDLFLTKFISDKPVVYKKLSEEELQLLDKEQVKRLVDTLDYTSPIITMSDNTKLKERLGYLSLYSCVVGLTLSIEKTKVFSYEDIYQIVDTIKSYNAIVSQVHVYLLQESDSLQIDNFFISAAAMEVNTSSRLNMLTEIEDDFADEDADIGIINGELKLSILINQCRKHEAYTNQRM
ncbi:4836_t:CDS:2, partial [Dentiscutata erythropus]